EGRAPHKTEIGTETQGDQDIGAAANPAVEKQGQLVTYSSLDRRQYVERAGRLIELAPAMIGYEDPVATDVERAQCVGRAHDSLHDEGAREQLAVGFQIAPGLGIERAQRAGMLVDLLCIRTLRRVRLPVAEHRRAAAAFQIFDNPAGMR